MVVLNGPDHKIILNDSYNTYTDKRDDSARLIKDMKNIPDGSVVIAAVKDDAIGNMSHEARAVFTQMGSKMIKDLPFKSGWGFIGIKGMKKSGENKGVTVEFGTVMSFTKVVKKATAVQKVEGGSKIQALSQGKTSGNNARVIINDVDVLEKAGRGINVVALAGQNHEVIYSKSYDTFGDSKASQRLVDDEAGLPLGAVIIVVVKDEASKRLTDAAKDVFTNMGAKEISQLGFREGWLFIGMKGSKQHIEKRGGSVNAGMILGYSRVVKRTRTRRTKTVTQTRSWKKTITKVYKEKQTKIVNGVKTTRIITRTRRRVVTCTAKRHTKSTQTTSKTTVN